jgi:hypothetical protein
MPTELPDRIVEAITFGGTSSAPSEEAVTVAELPPESEPEPEGTGKAAGERACPMIYRSMSPLPVSCTLCPCGVAYRGGCV